MRPILAIHLLLLCLFTSAQADDTARLLQLLSQPGNITIPAGDYHLDGTQPIPLRSNSTIVAHGARFILPKRLPDQTRIILFSGENIAHFTWIGGEFVGHVFDPARQSNDWEPNVNTKGIEITTSRLGETHDLLFREIRSEGMAGAVIGVHGLPDPRNESNVSAFAERVALESCTLLRSGKFMWDYGYLWQIVTFPEAFQPWELERAHRYFRTDLLHDVSFSRDSDRIVVENPNGHLKRSTSDAPTEAITFIGSELPPELVRGRQYFVAEAGPDFIRVAETTNGPAIQFSRSSTGQIARDVFSHYLAAYAPKGSGPGKGAFDIVATRDVRVTGCQLSALGDTMHIQRCENVIFANNHIIGSRMGAFFLAEYCRNASITGNLVDGTNGSRVVSVEKSCTNITMTGNTFRNGGRGAWINQPVNFVMTGNLFINNTQKNDPNPSVGRIAYQTGKSGTFPELYFTLHEKNGSYGPILVRNNIFQLGDHCPTEAVTFAPNGHDLVFEENLFTTKPAVVVMDPSCTQSSASRNPGATTVSRPVDFHHGRR
jgi:hypothetical protein